MIFLTGREIGNEYDCNMEFIYDNEGLDKKVAKKTKDLITAYNEQKNNPALKLEGIFPGIRIEYDVKKRDIEELDKARKEFDALKQYFNS